MELEEKVGNNIGCGLEDLFREFGNEERNRVYNNATDLRCA